ncbi:MAG TPA: tail fiber protein [Beijerinckiaceae bacterium]|jgi:microcystin-dependent protein
MADPFVAEIRIFPFNFAPKGWAMCNGQILPISQNTALFSLLGTTYGGDGKSTFALPDLRDNVPLHAGQGPGLSLWDLGEIQGSEFVTLLESEMPAHTHGFMTRSGPGTTTDPTAATLAITSWVSGTSFGAVTAYTSTVPANAQFAQNTLAVAGGDLPHNNLMPYLVFNFCIAMQGVFPPRS